MCDLNSPRFPTDLTKLLPLVLGILSWVRSADRCPLCNDAVVSRDKAPRTPAVENNNNGKRLEEEHGTNPLPELMSSALYHLREGMQVKNANGDEKQRQKRSYSFMLHDHARYAHLVKRV